MELWAEMGNMLLPIIIAIVPVTVLVLASAGRTTPVSYTHLDVYKRQVRHGGTF